MNLLVSCLISFNGIVNPNHWCENAIKSLEKNKARVEEVYLRAKSREMSEFSVAQCLINNTTEQCSEFSEY